MAAAGRGFAGLAQVHRAPYRRGGPQNQKPQVGGRRERGGDQDARQTDQSSSEEIDRRRSINPFPSFFFIYKIPFFKADYAYILIDCPPSLSLLTVMALVSSHSLVVPLQTEFFALEGLTQLMKTIERIKVSLNPELKIRGILLTMYDKRNKLSSQVEKEVSTVSYQAVLQHQGSDQASEFLALSSPYFCPAPSE